MPKRKPLKDRTLREQYEARNILEGAPDSPIQVYDPEVHPKGLVDYFSNRLKQIEDPEKYATEHRLVYVTKPVRPPTLAGYAVSIGVRRETLWAWGKQHTEFDEAVGIAKSIEQQILIEQGLLGAYNPGVVALCLKNLQGWTDRVEETHKGSVTLHFDKQDEEA